MLCTTTILSYTAIPNENSYETKQLNGRFGSRRSGWHHPRRSDLHGYRMDRFRRLHHDWRILLRQLLVWSHYGQPGFVNVDRRVSEWNSGRIVELSQWLRRFQL